MFNLDGNMDRSGPDTSKRDYYILLRQYDRHYRYYGNVIVGNGTGGEGVVRWALRETFYVGDLEGAIANGHQRYDVDKQ